MISPYLIKIIPYYCNLTVGIASLWLGFYTLKKNWRSKLCWLFFLMCITSGFTSGFSAALDLFSFHFNYIEDFFVLSYPSFGGFVPSLSLLFLILFPAELPELSGKKKWVVLLPIPYFVYLGLGRLYYSKLYILDRILHIERTSFYLHYIFYCAIVYLSYFVVIKLKIRRSKSLKHINQLKIIFRGALIGGFLILLGMFLTYFKIFLYGYESGVFIFLGSIAIAMLKHQAFEIKTAFHYGLFWLVSRALVILPIIFIPLWLFSFLPNLNKITPIGLSIYGFLSILLFSVFQKTIFTKLDMFLLKRRLGLEKANIQFSETLYRIRKIEELADVVLKTLKQNLFSKEVFFLVPLSTTEKNWFEVFSSERFDHPSKIWINVDSIEKWITTLGSDKTFIFDEKKPSNLFENEMIPDELKSFDIRLMQVVTSETEDVLGVLFLSEKKDFKPYSRYETEFVSALSKATAMGLSGIYFHQKNKELAQAKTFLKEALDGISHELKTAFYSTSGIKDLVLKGGIKGEDDLKQLYLDTVSFSEYIFHMVRNYGLSEKIEVGNISLAKTTFSISDPILMAIKLNDYYRQDKDIDISIDGDQEIELIADKEKITVVLSNLINNAIKYSPKNSKICVKWEIRNKVLMIIVQDFGYGIPKDRLNSIFDKSTNQKVERGNNYFSLGFGLSVARSLIELHEGNIKMESEVEKGTAVTLQIPL